MVVSLAADAFNRAFSPWLYGQLALGSKADSRKIVRLMYWSFGGVAVVALVISIAAPFLVEHLLAEEFKGADRYVWWIALGFAFNGMYRVVSGVVFFFERTLTLSAITVACAVFNLGLNAWLVPQYGALGAAQATGAAFFVGFLLTWLVAQRIHPMPWFSREKPA